ncbi:MAG: cytochrome c oxidase assembly protein [Hellea sp.]|nr:cytochrome c oxidase assembly protein [Hellea sp.]
MPRNRLTAILLTLAAGVMLVGGFQFDVLYAKFCQITGYGGTTGRAELNDSEVLDRSVRVYFDSNVAPDLNWEFKPEQRYIDVSLGQSGLAYYQVKNRSNKPIVGTANFNVTPIKAAPFFIKTECFCFTEQLIRPGEKVVMPVLFFVDPQMDDEKRYDDIKELTLSYTFFKVENPETQVIDKSAAQSRDEVN